MMQQKNRQQTHITIGIITTTAAADELELLVVVDELVEDSYGVADAVSCPG